jgi:hypothetical protein
MIRRRRRHANLHGGGEYELHRDLVPERRKTVRSNSEMAICQADRHLRLGNRNGAELCLVGRLPAGQYGLDPTVVSPAAKSVLDRFLAWVMARRLTKSAFCTKWWLPTTKWWLPTMRFCGVDPRRTAGLSRRSVKSDASRHLFDPKKSRVSVDFPKWRLVTRLLGLGLVVLLGFNRFD